MKDQKEQYKTCTTLKISEAEYGKMPTQMWSDITCDM